ncbi:MAG: hypothetical protein ABL885_15355 [Methylophilaceae bacterium]
MKPRFPKVRCHIQRAFLAWYNKHQAQFPQSLQYTGRKDDYLEFSIVGLHPAIGIKLSWELAVYIEWQGEFWDYLNSFEAVPRYSSSGGYYYCELCDSEERKPFLNREVLWEGHVFNPFLKWLHDTLLPAKWLCLYRLEDGCTWAKLLTEPDLEATELLPVWLLES